MVPDPHAGTSAELSSGQVGDVRSELRPTTAAGPSAAPALWDGRAGAPGAATKRAELKAQLTADLDAHLARNKVDIDAAAGAGTIPLTALEGAANAAVEVTDDEYKSSYGASAATPTQAALRAGFEFKQSAGNLLDASDPATRAAAEDTDQCPIGRAVGDLERRSAEPPGAREHMAAHGFDPERTTHGEDTFLANSVITPFLTAAPRRTQLERYDRFGFGFQPDPGKIAILPQVVGSALGAGQPTPNVTDRQKMWSTWHIAVHEYLHNLIHPAFEAVVRGPVMREGVTEYFTKGVLTKVAPVAHQNVGLVRKVEGGTFTPPTTPAIVGPYATPPTYAANLAHVENISRIVPGGDGAVRSAYFQGHVEMLGLDPATRDFVAAPPVAADRRRRRRSGGHHHGAGSGEPIGGLRVADPGRQSRAASGRSAGPSEDPRRSRAPRGRHGHRRERRGRSDRNRRTDRDPERHLGGDAEARQSDSELVGAATRPVAADPEAARMTYPNSPRLLKGGLVLIDPQSSAVRRVIALQYNPDQLPRTLQVQASSGEGGERSEALRLEGPPVETIKLEAEIDATDQLADPDNNTTAVQNGIHPQLAVLELMIHPSSSQLLNNLMLSVLGAVEIVPMQAPWRVVWRRAASCRCA